MLQSLSYLQSTVGRIAVGLHHSHVPRMQSGCGLKTVPAAHATLTVCARREQSKRVVHCCRVIVGAPQKLTEMADAGVTNNAAMSTNNPHFMSPLKGAEYKWLSQKLYKPPAGAKPRNGVSEYGKLRSDWKTGS
jgi:hypothetical protein